MAYSYSICTACIQASFHFSGASVSKEGVAA
jgi:hypothetical protein